MTNSGSGIVWLASYPRSGNTWLRIFLVRLLNGASEDIDINKLPAKLGDMSIASNRTVFDEFSGIDSSELDPDEIDRLRPQVYDAFAAKTERICYVKAHDANLFTTAGERLMPESSTRATVYVARNPLDVAVSFAFFLGKDFDWTIAQMANPKFVLSFESGKLSTQLRQCLSTWSGHVTSWLDDAGAKCHLMRYEDMVNSPLETFTAMARFLDLPHDAAAIEDARSSASLDNSRKAEERHGFAEKPARMKSFFRAGRIGDWRSHLSAAQAAKIVADHRAVMERLGYLNPDGSPKF